MKPKNQKPKKKIANQIKQKTPRNKKTKLFLKFDEDAREEFLTGFHKRKNMRRKKAKKDLLDKLNQQKQELKTQIKEKMTDVEEVRMDKLYHALNMHKQVEVEEFDLPDHTVIVTDLSGTDFAGKTGMMLGANAPVLNDENPESENNPESERKPKAAKDPVDLKKEKKKYKKALQKIEKRTARCNKKKSHKGHKRKGKKGPPAPPQGRT